MNNGQDIKTLLTIGENGVMEFKRAVKPRVIKLENLKPYSESHIIANIFHQSGRADELGSGVRHLYHYEKLYSGAEPIFDEEDVFRLAAPLKACTLIRVGCRKTGHWEFAHPSGKEPRHDNA